MKKKWFRLDNAALIFPAVMRNGWNNAFRLSATLTETVDPKLLEQAVKEIQPRFPTYFVHLRAGLFWYYLEEVKKPVPVVPEYAYPLTHMSSKDVHRCCIRVLYHENRIAVELFHSVTDGTGGLLLLENLIARYLEIRYTTEFPHEQGLVDHAENPKPDESRDWFQTCSAKTAMSRRETTVYRLHGTPEERKFQHLITGILPTDALLEAAHGHHATVTAFLSAVMAESILILQKRDRSERRQKPVKITVPVNLRKLYGKETYRNFILTINVGVDPRFGDYSFDELCAQMSHQIASEAVPQKMAGRIAANVIPQKNKVIRIMPLPVKTAFMRLVYASSGERKGCINISNLGNLHIPDEMAPYLTRAEFIIGVQYSYPNNCSVLSYGGNTYINMIRNTKESELERLFFSRLVELGVPVSIESNDRSRKKMKH